MTLLEQYMDCMQKGDCVALADLFTDHGVIHDSSTIKAGMDTLHLEGKMAIEMMFHHKFGLTAVPSPSPASGTLMSGSSGILLPTMEKLFPLWQLFPKWKMEKSNG